MLRNFLISLLISTSLSSQSIECQQTYQQPYDQQIINCVFTSDSTYLTYDCVSINLTVTEKYQSINYLQGEHIRSLSSVDVNGLKVSSQICHYIPSQLVRIIPNLKKLEITFSGLLEISNQDTFQMKNLQILNLRGNRIGNLNYAVFKENTELTSIDFSDNFIAFIANDIFNSLHKLKFVDFSNNICVKNAPASDNIREWERELKRNCEIDEMKRGIVKPLWRIYQVINDKFNSQTTRNGRSSVNGYYQY